ncbi:MAG: DUF4369 domain-containing protein [Prevotella sp.]|nr:DUF4369 domain-containing protein [Prevotella sp.]
MIKRILFGGIMLATMVLAGCQSKDGVCRIKGTVSMEQFDGKQIFLVPLYGPQTAEYVDSVVIKDGKFEFTTDTVMMAKILMDYHFRFGVQTLLVVTEPGELQVSIDSVSSAHGTPQNDSLQAWKEVTERHNRDYGMANLAARKLKESGDTVQAAKLAGQANAIHLAYKNLTRKKAESMKGTVLGDFLGQLFPLTYKKKMPDGSIVTMNADTNEPVE